jgi:hypothetical protein
MRMLFDTDFQNLDFPEDEIETPATEPTDETAPDELTGSEEPDDQEPDIPFGNEDIEE